MAVADPRLLLGLALSAALSWLLAGLLSHGLGRLGLLDQPNARSSHHRPTPRGGGVAFITAALLLLSWLSPGSAGGLLLWIPVPLALVGLLDDRRGLPVTLRLLTQAATALALTLHAGWELPGAALAMVLAVAVINAINFMDGLDGLVASCLAIWLSLAALLLQLPALLQLAAAALGFLCWNWSPARVFMGDVGSTYLGAVMAGGLLTAAHSAAVGGASEPVFVLGLAALPLLADAFTCLLRRLLAGQRLWQAHRLHLYQRLQQAGWSHRRVAGLYAGLTALLVCVRGPAVGPAAAALLLLGLWLDRRWALPFAPSAADRL